MSTQAPTSRPSPSGHGPAPIWERGDEDTRVEFLQRGLAYEAQVIEVHIAGYARIPKGLAGLVAASVDRLRRAARGEGEKTYVYGIESGLASAAMNIFMQEHPDAAPLEHFSDRENALRIAYAYEARQIGKMLGFGGFPNSRRKIATEQVERMRMIAAGNYERGYASTSSRSLDSSYRELRSGETPAP